MGSHWPVHWHGRPPHCCTNLILATGCYGRGTLHNTGLSDAESSEIRRATGMLFLQEIGVITPFENRSLYDEQLMLPTVRLSRNLPRLYG
jgi:hypothetical protein